MVYGKYAWWGHCLIGSLERLLDGSMLKQRMWAVFYPSLLFYSVSTSFFVEVFWSGTVIKRSLHVEFLSISFDSGHQILPCSDVHCRAYHGAVPAYRAYRGTVQPSN